MRIIYCYNQYHLGDNIFSYILFYNIKDYIEKNDIIISYFAKPEYHSQLKEFNPSKNIILNDYYEEKGFNLWIGNREIFRNCHNEYNNIPYYIKFNIFLTNFFNDCLNVFNIQYQLQTFKYTDEDILYRYEKLSEKYKNIDILIINSYPCSGQYNYNVNEWNSYIYELNQKYNIVTTLKVNGVNCTLDEGLSIKDIAGLSTKVKVIIAINTGVVVPLLNTYTLSNLKKFYTFDRTFDYDYIEYPHLFENKINIRDIETSTLDKYILHD